jgi:hypothetical protein
MSRFLKWRYGAALAVLAFVTFACSETAKNPVAPEVASSVPLFSATVPFNSTGQCLGDDAVQYNSQVDGVSSTSDPGTIMNCTANDISIALATATTINGNAYHAGDVVTCNEGDTIQVGLTATLQQNANSERQDIGIWIALDGGGAETGSCNHYNLVAGTTGTVNGDGDQCAGMASGSTTTNVDLGTIPVVCTDLDNDGFVDVGACVAWSIPGAGGDDQTCADNQDGTLPANQATDFRAGTLPSNRSKCNCEPFSLPIIINKVATIEVKKVCVPTSDTGTFDLNIDGVVKKDNATCAGGAASTTGAVEVSAGTNADPGAEHNVSETDFTTANYTSTYACTGGTNAPASGTGTSIPNFTVNPDEVIVCTFTNTRNPGKIELVKALSPTTDPGLFNLFIKAGSAAGATVASATNVGDGGTTGAGGTTLAIGTYNLSETQGTGTLLSNYTVLGPTCVNRVGGGSVTVTSGNVTIGSNDDIICTITNTRNTGKIELIKATVPTTDVGLFNLFIKSGTTNVASASDVGNGGTTGAGGTTLATGTYGLSETAGTGTSLTNYVSSAPVCVNRVGGGSVTVTSGNVDLATGADIVCTITNSRKAVLIVDKVTVGGGTQLFDFSQTGIANFQLADATTPKKTVDILPGNVQVCELALAVAWNASFTVNGAPVTPTLNGTSGDACYTVALAYGDSTTIVVTNTPPPGGATRTIGYWKNWSSCAQSNGGQYQRAINRGTPEATLDFYLGGAGVVSIYPIGNITSLTCIQAVNLLSKNALDGTKRPGDPIYNMVAQLLGAKLNVAAGAGSCATLDQALIDAQTLLAAIGFDGTKYYSGKLQNYTLTAAQLAAAQSLAGIFASYNEGTLGGGCPTHI